MTIRTFWTIFIKILGIWLILSFITAIPQFLSMLSYIDPNEMGPGYPSAIALLLLIIGLYIFILRLFIFKTAWLINILHLDKGFIEEKIALNIKYSTILSIATIVIGGLIFVDGLPEFCKATFNFFQQKRVFGENPNSEWIIFYSVKTVIGYLLITNSQSVVKFIDRQKPNENDEK